MQPAISVAEEFEGTLYVCIYIVHVYMYISGLQTHYVYRYTCRRKGTVCTGQWIHVYVHVEGRNGIYTSSHFPMTWIYLSPKVTEVRLKKLEKDYFSFLEQQAQLEDPIVRLEVRC